MPAAPSSSTSRMHKSCNNTPNTSPSRHYPFIRNDDSCRPLYKDPSADEICPISLPMPMPPSLNASTHVSPVLVSSPSSTTHSPSCATQTQAGSPELVMKSRGFDSHPHFLSRGSSPLSRTTSTSQDSPPHALPGSRAESEAGRRRSLSSLGTSVAEAAKQQQQQQQQEKAAAAAEAAAGASRRQHQSGKMPQNLAGSPAGPGLSSPQHPDLAASAASKAAQQLHAQQSFSRATSEPSSAECMNWDAVEELCASMDAAGLRVEDIDILCLSPAPSGVLLPPQQSVKGKEGTKSTLLSLKFSNMTLRHYPGDDQAKQLFHDVLSK